MVPDQPPRRSKADKEPVTIDLSAEASEVVAEPVRSNDTDDAVPKDAAIDPAEAVQTAADQPPVNDAIDEPKADRPAGEPAFDGPPDAERRPETAAAAAERDTTSSWNPPETAPKSTSATAMIAAGIFGGIVALALAGSMQYAGYLPAATPSGGADNSSVSSEIAALQADIQTLKNRPSAGDPTLAGRIQALEAARSGGPSPETQQRIAAIESQLNDVKSATRATAGSDAELSRRLEEAEAKINDRGPEQQVARAVAAAALKAAIDRGGSFEPELTTYANVAGDDPAVAQLRNFAANGVPSRAELQREFPRIADAMLEAANQPDPNQGLGSRLLASAMSVVKVRQVGNLEGDTPEAITARIEETLRNGDLAASAREWNALPEPAKAVSQEFKQKLDARVQVENLVGGTLTRAVAGTQG